MSMIPLSAAAAATGTLAGVIADRAANANTYFSMGAALTVILGFFVLPAWRAFRTARQERATQIRLLHGIHDIILGRPENREEGIEALTGLVDRVGSIEKTLEQGSPAMREIVGKIDSLADRLTGNERAIAEARRIAGQAATVASSARDRVDFLNDRMWEQFEGLRIRNEMLTGLMQEAGYEVGEMPPLDMS